MNFKYRVPDVTPGCQYMDISVVVLPAVPPIATVAITTRNYDRRICVAFASQMPEARANTPKKGQDPGRVAGGHGGG